MKIMLKYMKYIHTVKAIGLFMMTMPLLLSFVLLSCQGEENIMEQFSDEDNVTVRLNLSTRSVEAGESDMLDEYSSEPANWYKTGTLFPKPPALPRIALMIFNKDLDRYVYNSLISFNPDGTSGRYQIKVRIPKGETEFYAFMLPIRRDRICLIILLKEIFAIRFHGIF